MLQFWREALLPERGFTTFKRNPCADGVRIRWRSRNLKAFATAVVRFG